MKPIKIPEKTQIFLAGHGGQGVLDLGNFLAYQAIMESKHAVCTPSYGPETRGGKVRCYVILSKGQIDSPIAEVPDVMMIMNLQSMDFEPLLRKDGLFFYNTSLTEGREPTRDDVTIIPVPATGLANSLKESLDDEYLKGIRDVKMAQNCSMYGAYLEYTKQKDVDLESIFSHFYTGKKSYFNKLNIAAVEVGRQYIKDQGLG